VTSGCIPRRRRGAAGAGLHAGRRGAAEPAAAARDGVVQAAGGAVAAAELAPGESAINYKSPLNALKDTYDHSCH
jgi:hypothetical protein